MRKRLDLSGLDDFQVLTRRETADVLNISLRTLDRAHYRKVRRGRYGTGYLVRDVRQIANIPKEPPS